MIYFKPIHRLLLVLPLVFIANSSFGQVASYLCSHEKGNRWTPVLRTAQGDSYDQHYLVFDLQLSNNSNAIAGNVTIHAKALALVDTFWFELRNHMAIDSLLINGSRTSFLRQQDVVKVPLSSQLAVNQSLVCQVFYSGTPPNTGQFFNSVTTANHFTWKKPTTYTLSQPYGAPDWFPCKQDNTDKIDSVYFMGTVDDSLTVATNGLLQQIENLPNGKRKFHWKTRYPTAMYLIGFSVAKYVEFRSFGKPSALAGDSIMIQHMVYDAELPDLGRCIDHHRNELLETNRLIELMSDSFGVYPFYKEKYGHMHAPMGGGMEHQTMSTMGFFGVGLNAHELIHQWFGDYVTCENWEHIWLNEGFGSYGEYFNLEHTNPAAARAWMDDAHNQAVTEPLGSIVAPPNPVTARIFNRALTYKKSAAVIRMLRYQMGDASFYKGVRAYLDQHAFGTANSNQFKSAMEASSGQDLATFFNEWVFGYGFPGYQIRWNQVGDSILIDIRSVGSSPQTPSFSIPIPLRAESVSGESTFFNLSPGVYKLPVSGITSVLWLDEGGIILKGISNVDRDPGFVSIRSKELKAFTTVWPNPSATGNLVVRFDYPGDYQLSVLSSASGKELYRAQTSQPKFETKLLLSQGIYLLEIRDLKTEKVAHWKWAVTGN